MTNTIGSILGSYAKSAEGLMGSAKGIGKLLEDARPKIRDERMNGILNRGQAFINYLISPKVPIGKRITIVAGILYLVSPLSFPGPIDELVVLSWLMPFVNGELEAFDKGIYNCNFLPKESKQSRTGNPILDIFEETDALIERTENKDDSNPLLRLM